MARISEAFMLFLLNAGWQVALIAVLAFAGDRLLRRSRARERHILWAAALVACVALALSSPARISLSPSRTAAISIAPDSFPESELDSSSVAAAHAAARAKTAPAPLATKSRLLPLISLSQAVAFAIATIYALLLLFRAAAFFRAWQRTRAIIRSAHWVELPPPVEEAVARCRRVLNAGTVSILVSKTLAVPVTARTLRPVLILPEALLESTDSHLLLSAVGHEMAHIARRDYLFNLLYEIASLPLWFHPGMQLVLRRIRQTRELRCDELVTERLLEPRAYAESLVQLAGAALPFGRPAATITVGIADANILEERIMTILKHSPLRRRSTPLIIAALLLIVPCIAAAPLSVRVAIHQPAIAVAVPQSSTPAAAATAPAEPQKEVPETVAVQTPDGEVRINTVGRPKVGDVLVEGDQKLKITRIDANGQYHALVLNKSGVPSGEEKTFLYAGRGYAFTSGEQDPQDPQARTELEAVRQARTELIAREKEAEAALQQDPQAGADRAAQERELIAAVQAQEQAAQASQDPQARAARAAQEQELMAARQKVEQAERALLAKTQADLAGQVRIPMDQALQIAQRDTPGTIVEARLIGERGQPNYLVIILPQNAGDSGNVKLLINAVDGTVVKPTERLQLRAPRPTERRQER